MKTLERIDAMCAADEAGDVLIFLSGINEINLLAEDLDVYALQSKYVYEF